MQEQLTAAEVAHAAAAEQALGQGQLLAKLKEYQVSSSTSPELARRLRAHIARAVGRLGCLDIEAYAR